MRLLLWFRSLLVGKQPKTRTVGDMINETVGPSEKVRMVVADFNFIRKEARVTAKESLEMLTLVHYPLYIGSQAESARVTPAVAPDDGPQNRG